MLTCHFSSYLYCSFSGFSHLFFLLFCAFYVWQIAMFVLSTMRLVDMYHFYTYLLQIPDVRLPHLPPACHLSTLFSRKTSRPSPGPKLSDALELSATLIHSPNSPRRLHVHARVRVLNWTRMTSQTVSCGKKTSLSRSSTKSYLI